METKKTKKNPYKVFKDLTIANTTIAWIEFLYVLGLTVVAALIWKDGKTIDKVSPYVYVVYAGTALLLANIGLAIAQSVYAKKIGKISKNIGYEQVICILIMLIAFAFLVGDAGVYCGSKIFEASKEQMQLFGRSVAADPDQLWYIYIAAVCLGVCALSVAGFASYNTVLCTKVKVFKTKTK